MATLTQDHRQQVELEFYARHPDETQLVIAQCRAVGCDDLNKVDLYTWVDPRSKEPCGWNVSLAKWLAKSKTCEEIIVPTRDVYERLVASERSPINHDHAMSIDLATAHPGIAVKWLNKTRELEEVMIDGSHRIYAAHKRGQVTWPMRVLSREASLACELPRAFTDFLISMDG